MGNRLAASQKQEYRQKGPNIEKLVFQFLQTMQVGQTLTIRKIWKTIQMNKLNY